MNEMKKIPYDMTEEEMRAADEAYFKLLGQHMELELKLIEKMPEELMDLFREYMDVETDVFFAETQSEYARGFRSGVRWALNNLQDSEK